MRKRARRYRAGAVMRHVLDLVDRGELPLPVARQCAESIATAQLLGWRKTLVVWELPR